MTSLSVMGMRANIYNWCKCFILDQNVEVMVLEHSVPYVCNVSPVFGPLLLVAYINETATT